MTKHVGSRAAQRSYHCARDQKRGQQPFVRTVLNKWLIQKREQLSFVRRPMYVERAA